MRKHTGWLKTGSSSLKTYSLVGEKRHNSTEAILEYLNNKALRTLKVRPKQTSRDMLVGAMVQAGGKRPSGRQGIGVWMGWGSRRAAAWGVKEI